MGQVKVSNSAEGLGQIRILVAPVQHHVGVSVLLILPKLHAASSGISALPHRSSQLWGESWQSTTLISVLPWLCHGLMSSLIEPHNSRHALTGVEERFILLLTPPPCQSVAGSLLFWYDNSSPFRSGHVCSFLVFIFSSKAPLDVQWGRLPNSLKETFVDPMVPAKSAK